MLCAMLAITAPLAAQGAPPDSKVQVMITREKERYGAPAPKPVCKKVEGDDIQVCGGRNDGAQWRVPPTSTTDPRSAQALRDGLPRAPNVSGLPDCTVVKCHGFGRVPPPVYYIDLKSIPEAPEGSDAEKVANGEMTDR